MRRNAAGKDGCAVGVDAIELIGTWKGLRVRDNPLWLLSAANTDTARAAAQVFGTVYLALSILGFLAVGAALNALALNMGDNILHLVSGGGALLISVFAQRRPTKPSAPERFADLRG